MQPRPPALRPQVLAAATVAPLLLLTACSDGSGADGAVSGAEPAASTATAAEGGAEGGVEGADPAAADAVPPHLLTMEVIAEHPWDDSAFTQGLEIDDDRSLLVGTGQRGESAIYRVPDWRNDPGHVDRHDLPEEFFGEGITRAGDTVWQLTWQENTAIARDAATLEETHRAEYDTEGWGLCAFQDELVMSDGTGTLTFRDPVTFDALREVEVTAAGNPVTHLNELECVDGADGPEVWANIWTTNEIARIDPATGIVTGAVDASTLREGMTPEQADRADVFNGIAHIPGTDHFLVTGKWWPTLFEVRFTPA